MTDFLETFHDARGGWNRGFRSCAHWLSWRVGLDLGAARERVRVARALSKLPLLAEALAHGELSYAKVRALTRIATPETEPQLLKVGRAGTAVHVERIVRGWRYVDRKAEAQETARQHAMRGPHVYQDEDGGRVSAETCRRLACDASRVVMRHDEDGRVVEVGARTRTIPPAIRRALHHRDRGGRFPGCGFRVGEGHHVRHWAEGGPTTLSNLALLCRRHHRAVHEDGYRVKYDRDGTLEFRRPDGQLLPAVPSDVPVLGDPVGALKVEHDALGLRFHARTACPSWLGEKLDVGWAIDVLHPPARTRSAGAQ